jgi:hypothetical protein
MPRSAQVTAAATVRGSLPSGNTMSRSACWDSRTMRCRNAAGLSRRRMGAAAVSPRTQPSSMWSATARITAVARWMSSAATSGLKSCTCTAVS